MNSIVEAKIAAGHYREHPDLPGDAEMILYYVPRKQHDYNTYLRSPVPAQKLAKVLVDLSHCSEEETRDSVNLTVDTTMDAGSEARVCTCGLHVCRSVSYKIYIRTNKTICICCNMYICDIYIYMYILYKHIYTICI